MGLGLGLDVDMGLGLEGMTAFGNMDTIESTEGGFTATWLDSGNLFDYTTMLLEGVADSSAPSMMPLMSSLSESVEVA